MINIVHNAASKISKNLGRVFRLPGARHTHILILTNTNWQKSGQANKKKQPQTFSPQM